MNATTDSVAADSTTATVAASQHSGLGLKTALGRLRLAGYAEGISFLLLLGVAMPLKYLAGQPQAVRIIGMAHGILFLLYVWLVIQTALEYRWTWRRTTLAFVASLLPAGPFIFDRRIYKPGVV
ncbi:DUF3817 domain-containing protein [Opitutaceae bacterium TAV4]|nr:DUF3817 domain-containing protein [Opitutaceae bacterium TAV4]RRJ99649.1 DUF3817 domain-containing protein [Opitutaceae bacterium TAV3]